VYLAAERTMLARLRTGLIIRAFGFVFAQFGFFMKILAFQIPDAPPHAHL
jgi:putative membrane protein